MLLISLVMPVKSLAESCGGVCVMTKRIFPVLYVSIRPTGLTRCYTTKAFYIPVIGCICVSVC